MSPALASAIGLEPTVLPLRITVTRSQTWKISSRKWVM